MTVAFFCDRCDKRMERESSDRFYIRGPTTTAEDQLDLCTDCLDAVKDFMRDRQTDRYDDDDSVRTNKRRERR